MSTVQNCLVVGAGGFLGQHVCAVMQTAPRVVISASSNNTLTERQGWLYLDVTVQKTLDHLPKCIDSVIYLAQSPYYKDFPARAAHIWNVNVQGVLRLLEYARMAGARHFVLASSGSVYASSSSPVTETSPLVQGMEGNFYIRSKMAAELLLNAYSVFFSTVCLRLFTLYGPGLRSSMLMSRMARSIREGLPIILGGDDGLVFNPLHVKDAARAVVAALELQGCHTVNVAGAEVLTLGEMCRLMGRRMGYSPRFIHQGKSQYMVGDISTMRTLLVEPQLTAEEGLADFVDSDMV